jgi:hypothetical protein
MECQRPERAISKAVPISTMANWKPIPNSAQLVPMMPDAGWPTERSVIGRSRPKTGRSLANPEHAPRASFHPGARPSQRDARCHGVVLTAQAPGGGRAKIDYSGGAGPVHPKSGPADIRARYWFNEACSESQSDTTEAGRIHDCMAGPDRAHPRWRRPRLVHSPRRIKLQRRQGVTAILLIVVTIAVLGCWPERWPARLSRSSNRRSHG